MQGRAWVSALITAILGIGAAALLVQGARAREPGAARAVVERLLSPGPVDRHHLKADCLTCHAAFRGATNAGCLAGRCHSPGDLVADAEHPAVAELHRQTNDQPCTRCHTEHTGGRLTIAFHQGEGVAARAEDCAACHGREAARAHPDIADTRCAACHTSTRDWKQVHFDHRLVEGERCTACHRGPDNRLHQVARDFSCSLCHITDNWERVRLQRHPRLPEFREHMRIPCLECHPRTLARAVACEDCHGRGGFFERE